MTDRQTLIDSMTLAQRRQEEDRQQRIRELEIKAKRCVSEIAWRFFPDGGVRKIDVDPAEQLMAELFAALRELRATDRRDEEGGDGRH